jgi:amidase
MRSLKEKLAALHEGTLLASDNLHECLKVVDSKNPEINALVYLNSEEAKERAKLLDSLSATNRRALHGAVFSVKDNFPVAGLPCSEGSTQTLVKVSRTTDPLVSKILSEGAILIGKGNMPEYGKSNFTDNNLYGRTLNPWNKSHTPGGSTGGDAVAVATGMSDFALGGDSGGSLRVPASLCGLYSILPSRDLIKKTDSPFILNTFLKKMGSTGPLARTLSDLEVVFDLLARSSPSDQSPGTPGQRTFSVLREVAGVGCANEIESDLDKVTSELRNKGWREIPIPQELFDATVPVFFILGGQAGTLQEDLVREHKNIKIDPSLETKTIQSLRNDIKTLMPKLTAESLLLTLYQWEELQNQADSFLKKVDIIIAPVSASLALPFGANEASVRGASVPSHHLFHFARAANVLNIPALAFPTSVSNNGLPVGLQIMTRSGHDKFMFRVLEELGQSSALQ